MDIQTDLTWFDTPRRKLPMKESHWPNSSLSALKVIEERSVEQEEQLKTENKVTEEQSSVRANDPVERGGQVFSQRICFLANDR